MGFTCAYWVENNGWLLQEGGQFETVFRCNPLWQQFWQQEIFCKFLLLSSRKRIRKWFRWHVSVCLQQIFLKRATLFSITSFCQQLLEKLLSTLQWKSWFIKETAAAPTIDWCNKLNKANEAYWSNICCGRTKCQAATHKLLEIYISLLS